MKLISRQHSVLGDIIADHIRLAKFGCLNAFKIPVRRGVARLGCCQNRVTFDDPAHSCTMYSIARTAMEVSIFLCACRCPFKILIYSQLDLSSEDFRYLSACFSLEFFKVIKKLISNLRGGKESRETTFHLLLALTSLDIILGRRWIFKPEEYSDMKEHLSLYVKHYKTKLERMSGPAELAIVTRVTEKHYFNIF